MDLNKKSKENFEEKTLKTAQNIKEKGEEVEEEVDKLSKTNHKARYTIVQEIMATETTYVKNLTFLQDLYIQPLQEKIESSYEILNAEQINIMFSSLQIIRGLNAKFLSDLNERFRNQTFETSVGDLFVQFAPFFKMYTEYVNNYDQAMILLNELQTSKTVQARRFQKFAKNCQNHENSSGLVLQSYLILPIQRIPRYQLLIKELLANTDNKHSDRKPLNEAQELVKETALHINEAVRLSENRQIIQRLQSRFQGRIDIVQPHRVFIRQGQLLRKTRRTTPKFFTFFLFNDLLIYASEAFSRYILHQSIPIDKSFSISQLIVGKSSNNNPIGAFGISMINARSNTNISKEHRFGWKIISSVKSFVVYAKSEEERSSQIEDISKCVEKFQSSIKKTKDSSSDNIINTKNKSSEIYRHEPVLQSANESDSCLSCHQLFTFLNRRHNCRKCGQLVCSDCSKTRMVIKGSKNKKPQRVCRNCADTYIKLNSSRSNLDKNILKNKTQPKTFLNKLFKLIGDSNQDNVEQKANSNENSNVLQTITPEIMDLDRQVQMPHKEHGYLPAKIINQNHRTIVFETIYKERCEEQINSELLNLPQATTKGFFVELDDLINLDDFSEGSILQQLRIRYKKDKIYTNIGGVLIAINPFKLLHIYTQEYLDLYKQKQFETDFFKTSNTYNQKEQLNSIYSFRRSKSQISIDFDEIPPHVFDAACEAYKTLCNEQANQSIIISGESGSGKTETTKLILFCLSELSNQSANQIEENILVSSPIFEAFGNAKTVQNNNSSRFGKYVQIIFSSDLKICGAQIKNYLLEKARVVHQSQQERNFHIFYQFCEAFKKFRKDSRTYSDLDVSKIFEDELLDRFLLDTNEFNYLNQSKCLNIEGVDDSEDFLQTIISMKRLKFSSYEISLILRLLLTILYLGQIEFDVSLKTDSAILAVISGTDEKAVRISKRNVLDTIEKLSGIDKKALEDAVCFHQIRVGSDLTMVPLGASKARSFRDTLAKYIYYRLFDQLVARINHSLMNSKLSAHKEVKPNKLTDNEECSEINYKIVDNNDNVYSNAMTSIGVLDIYGFEVFETNSLEQFFINYANEVLQQHFNFHIFKSLQDEYTCDGIEQVDIPFKDNKNCLELIESKNPAGILTMLDEELKVPQCSDLSFINRMHQTFHEQRRIRHPCYDRYLKHPMLFVIKHYAGNVEYNVEGFVEKNKDKLHEALEDLLCHRNTESIKQKYFNPLLTAIQNFMSKDYGHPIKEHNAKPDVYQKQSKQINSKEDSEKSVEDQNIKSKPLYVHDTLGTKFRRQLESLMIMLKSTRPIFIRCIKPNFDKLSNQFDSQLVLRQMKNAGLFETIRIRREGYPRQAKHKHFLLRYNCIRKFNIGSDNIENNFQNSKIKFDDDIEKQTNLYKLCEELIEYLKVTKCIIDEKSLILGKTRVFQKIFQDRLLESHRRLALNCVVNIIQRTLHTKLVRRKYLACKNLIRECRQSLLCRDTKLIERALKHFEEVQTSLSKKKNKTNQNRFFATACSSFNLLAQYIYKIQNVQIEIVKENELIKQFEEALRLNCYDRMEAALIKADELHSLNQRPRRYTVVNNNQQASHKNKVNSSVTNTSNNSAKPSNLDLVLCMYDYTAREPDELSFKINDVIEVLERPPDDDQWIGKLNNKEGTFPCNYTEPFQNRIYQGTRVRPPEHPRTVHFQKLHDKCQQLLYDRNQRHQPRSRAVEYTERSSSSTKSSSQKDLNDDQNTFNNKSKYFDSHNDKNIETSSTSKSSELSLLSSSHSNQTKNLNIENQNFCQLNNIEVSTEHTKQNFDLSNSPNLTEDYITEGGLPKSLIEHCRRIFVKHEEICSLMRKENKSFTSNMRSNTNSFFTSENIDNTVSEMSTFSMSSKTATTYRSDNFGNKESEEVENFWPLKSFCLLRSDSDQAKGMLLQIKKRKKMLKNRFQCQSKTLLRSMCKFSLRFCGGSAEKRTQLKLLSIQSFNNILGYMKIKYHAYPETSGYTVVKTGFCEPLIRDEIYCQLVKQTTNAMPSEELLGWKLIFLCLCSFMPTLNSSFEHSSKFNKKQDSTNYPPFSNILLNHILRNCCHDIQAIEMNFLVDFCLDSISHIATHCLVRYVMNLVDDDFRKTGSGIFEPSLEEVKAVSNGKFLNQISEQ